MVTTIKTSATQNICRVVLGLFMLTAGLGHLTFARTEFQAQVPDWVPFTKDFTVVASGYVEIALGLTLIFFTRYKVLIGIGLALFYIAVFPGNISQYTHHRDMFGLDNDTARLVRLFFQPVLILCALWSTGAIKALRERKGA